MGWEDELDAAWNDFSGADPATFVARIQRIVDHPEVPVAIRDFEVAGAYDATDATGAAVAAYRRALDAGLDDHRARQATIQLASSLRALGDATEGLRLLSALDTDSRDDLDDAVIVFRALMLADLGREREALATSLHALANHLPRYRISAQRYAAELPDRPRGGAAG